VRHANALGWGYRAMKAKGLYWVLTNISISIDSFPHWNSSFSIRTWPSSFNRMFATRQFLGCDSNENIMFRAASEWMILDRTTRKPQNMKDLSLGIPRTDQTVFDETPRRLKPEGNWTACASKEVPFSSMDMNGHVNNTEYIRWAFDAVRKANIKLKSLNAIQVTFLSEVFENDKIIFSISESRSPESLKICGRIEETNKPVFVTEIVY
jgi:medium-chain acyl-[acyl-carrier-protein] hydrolase